MRIGIFLFSVLLISLLLFSFSPKKTTFKKQPKPGILIMVLLNSDDCRNCLKHGYSLLNQLIESAEKGSVIILLSEKREESKQLERKELSMLIDLEKTTLLWNDSLCSRVREAAEVEENVSAITIYNKVTSRFVYASPLKKVVSYEELQSHLKHIKN